MLQNAYWCALVAKVISIYSVSFWIITCKQFIMDFLLSCKSCLDKFIKPVWWLLKDFKGFYLLTSLPQLRNSSIKTIELTALEGKIVVNSKEWKGHSRSVTNFRCFIHIGQISWLLLLKENPNAVTHQYEMFPSFFFFPVLFIFFSWVRQFYCTAKHTCMHALLDC